MIERLKETLAQAEGSASDFEIEEIAWMIGNFPLSHPLRSLVSDCPRIAALLPEMEPRASAIQAMLMVGQWMNREDIIGAVADRIRKVYRP